MNHDVSKRELQVLELIAEGHTDMEIAAELNISLSTANCHRKKLLSKLGAKNAAMLIRIAIRKEIIK